MNHTSSARNESEDVTDPARQTWLATTGDRIAEFLRQKRIAIVGVSRNQYHFSRSVMKEFRKRGYEVVPCNPSEEPIDGLRSFPNLLAITPPVDAVLIMTPPAKTPSVLNDCLTAGITRIWIHKGASEVSGSDISEAFCERNDLKVISGQCPLMFLSDSQLVHRVHGWFKKMRHTYPA